LIQQKEETPIKTLKMKKGRSETSEEVIVYRKFNQIDIEGKIFCMTSTASRHIWAGFKDGDLSVFSQEGKRLAHRTKAHDSAIKTLLYDPQFNVVLSGSDDGTVKVWRLDKQTQEHPTKTGILERKGHYIYHSYTCTLASQKLTFQKKTKIVEIPLKKASIKLINNQEFSIFDSFSTKEHFFRSKTDSDFKEWNEALEASVSVKQRKIINIEMVCQVQLSPQPGVTPINHLVKLSSSPLILCSSLSLLLQFIKIQWNRSIDDSPQKRKLRADVVSTIPIEERDEYKKNPFVTFLLLVKTPQNQQQLAWASVGESILVIDLDTRKIHRVISKAHKDIINSMIEPHLSITSGQQDKHIISCGNDGMIKVWSLTTYQCLQSIETELGRIFQLLETKRREIFCCGWSSKTMVQLVKKTNSSEYVLKTSSNPILEHIYNTVISCMMEVHSYQTGQWLLWIASWDPNICIWKSARLERN